MPPKKASTKSPYFKATPPARKSNRVSNTSLSSAAKKRQFPSSESEFDDDDLSGSDFRITKKGRKSNTGRRSRVKRSESEDESSHLGDEHEGEDDGDTDDEAKPPKTVIIPLPKVRDAGDIPYEDGRLHGNTMLFLKDLKKNNNREWMKCVLTLFLNCLYCVSTRVKFPRAIPIRCMAEDHFNETCYLHLIWYPAKSSWQSMTVNSVKPRKTFQVL
jgi:hypothetical protein